MTDIIKGAGGGGCFAKGTLIATPDGLKPIESLAVGDDVIAFDDAGNLSNQTVEACHFHENEPIHQYNFWNGISVLATPNHWVLNQYGNFAEIGTLTEQDAIIDGDGHIRPLLSVEYITNGNVYNLTVSNVHTYIANNIRVHNTGKGAGRLTDAIKGAGGGGGGKGGGGGSSRVAQEAPDSLRSIQYANFIDLVSEGEIEGLVNDLKSVYLDETPIQNDDGSYNFTNVKVIGRTGTQNQTYINGFTAAESEIGVGVEVTNAASVTRTITTPNVDSARVTISIPQLTSQDLSTGDINGTSVEIALDVQTDGGGFVAQPIRFVPSTSKLAIGAVTSNTEAASSFYLDVVWGVPSGKNQRIDFKIQYKLQSSSTWLDYGQYTLDTGLLKSFNKPIYGIFGLLSLGTFAGSVTREYGLTLPNGLYDFRLTYLSGVGSVSIYDGFVGIPTYTDVISGKTTSKYQRSYYLTLPPGNTWDIRVRRITPDSTSSALVNRTFWDSYTEIVDEKFTYPNSAIVGVQIDSKQFNRIPVRGYDIRGIKVKVPSNYDPLTRVYTGTWDGTFVVKWTDNPAWIFYDLVTNERYGLGEIISESMVDKWGLYDIAKYCDVSVDDGYGGKEPRFTCNMYLQTREQAFQVIMNLASVFRSMAYWSGGSIYVSQDSPKDVSQIFSAANVIDGAFSYSGSSGKVRHTVALVSWNDPADGYRPKIEYVADDAGIERYGIVQADLTAIGCTSRGQAARLGRWMIYSELNEIETISFRAGLDSVFIQAGDIIETNDVNRAGKRYGGRVQSATTTAITLDDNIIFESGKNYEISCKLADGTIETRTVTNTPGTTNVVTLATALTSAPEQYAMWLLSASDLVPEKWRVVSIAENDKNEVEITALAYREDKYDAVEKNLVLQPLPTSIMDITSPSAPTNFKVTESLYSAGLGVVGVKATVSWDADPLVKEYIVTYKSDTSNLESIQTSNNTIDIYPIAEGRYTFSIVALNTTSRSTTTSIIVDILGKTLPPANVSNFAITNLGAVGLFTWDATTDLDVSVGGKVKFRYSPNPLASWETSSDLPNEAAGNATSITLPLKSGVYFAKFMDSSGNYSTTATAIATDAYNLLNINFIEDIIAQPSWTGAKVNTQLYTEFGDPGLVLSSYDLWDSADLIDSDELVDFGGGTASSGTYSMGYLDLGSVQTSRVSSLIEAYGVDTQNLWDADELIDSTELVDNATSLTSKAVMWYRTTNDDPAGTPVWSDWNICTLADINCRALDFELRLSSSELYHNILVEKAEVSIDMPDRVESGDNLISGLTDYAVTYGKPFMVNPAIGISIENMNTGDYYSIVSKTNTGFTIRFYDASANRVSRTFDYIAKAY